LLRTVVVIFLVLHLIVFLNYCIQLFGYPAASVLINSMSVTVSIIMWIEMMVTT